MEKKTIFLELPIEIIENIDRQNAIGDRSLFISDLLKKQLERNVTTMDASTDLTTRIDQIGEPVGGSGEIHLTNNNGTLIGNFNINTIAGFEELSRKISEITKNSEVRMRARLWL
jgi:hypothetical protein